MGLCPWWHPGSGLSGLPALCLHLAAASGICWRCAGGLWLGESGGLSAAGTAVCGDHPAVSGIRQELRWQSDVLRALKLDILIESSISAG